MSGRRSTAVYGMVFGNLSIMVSLARNILFVPIYLHSISLPEYGAWLATGGALALMLINDFGLSGVVTQKISAALGAGDLAALGSLAGSAQVIGVMMALILTALSLLLVPVLPGLQTLTAAERHTVANCFVIAAAANGTGLLGATAISVIRSLQQAVFAGIIVLIADIANLAFTLVGLLRGAGLYAVADAMLVRSAIVAVAAGAGVWLVCSRNLRVPVLIRWRSVRELLGDSARFFLSAVAMKVQAQANVFFVNAVLGPTSAATYSLTVRAHETVMMLLGQVNMALVPSVTHLFGSGNLTRYREVLMRLLISLTGISALALSATIILNAGFLRLWVGRYGFAGQDVSIFTGVALFVSSIGYIAYDALVAQGKFRVVANAFIVTSSLQVILLAAFLSSGVWFAPLATLLAAIVWSAFFWRKAAVGIRMTSLELRGIMNELVRIILVSAAAVSLFLLFYPPTNSWPSLIAEGVVCFIVLLAGYLGASAQLRSIMREEIGMTLRALRTT